MSTRIEGIIDRLTDAKEYNDISWILDAGVVTNYTQSIVDDHIKANIDFQGKAGIPVTVERIRTGNHKCDFCEKRAGKYTYPDVPDAIWQRHRECKCYIIYTTGDFRRTLGGDTQKWEILNEETFDQRKKVGLTTPTKKELTARKIVGTERKSTEIKRKEALIQNEYRNIQDARNGIHTVDGERMVRVTNPTKKKITDGIKNAVANDADGLLMYTDKELTAKEIENLRIAVSEELGGVSHFTVKLWGKGIDGVQVIIEI